MTDSHSPFDLKAQKPLVELRWLACEVLKQLPDVPAPLLVSSHIKHIATVRDYVLRWAERPDAGSSFASRTGWLSWMPFALRWRLMEALGYDGIVYLQGDGAVSGHVFFQRRGDALHGFSTGASGDWNGRGYSILFMLDYVALAAMRSGIVRARVGTGQNIVTQRLLTRLRKLEEQLKWQVNDDGWVIFSPKASGLGS